MTPHLRRRSVPRRPQRTATRPTSTAAAPAATPARSARSASRRGDCASGTCGANNTCVATQCMDGEQDGAETDKDCGGGTCPTCVLGQKCADGTRDCSTSLSATPRRSCASPTSATTAPSTAARSDADCGGGTCPSARAGQRLQLGATTARACAATRTRSSASPRSARTASRTTASPTSTAAAAATTCAPPAPTARAAAPSTPTAPAACATTSTGLCVHTSLQRRTHRRRRDRRRTAAAALAAACGAGLICKANGDCGSSACDFGPVAAQVHHRCVRRPPPGRQRDRRRLRRRHLLHCAVGKKCAQDTDCQTGYCDPGSHMCACGGIGQACCAGGTCTHAVEPVQRHRQLLARPTSACSRTRSSARRRRTSARSPARAISRRGCARAPQSQRDTAVRPARDRSVHRRQHARRARPASARAARHVADRCVGNDAQTCNNNTWTTKQTCANGCTGNGVCNVPTVPTLTATRRAAPTSASAGQRRRPA